MKSLKLSKRYLSSKRNLNYCLKLFHELEKYYYDPVLDRINDAAFVSVPCTGVVFHGIRIDRVDRVYGHDLSSAKRILSIYRKLFHRIPDCFFLNRFNIDCADVCSLKEYVPSTFSDLSDRLLYNDHDGSLLFEVLNHVKLNFSSRLNRLPNDI